MVVASSQARFLRRPASDPGGSHCRSGPAKAGARPGMPAQGCHGGIVENCRTPVVPAVSPVPGRHRQRRRTQGSVAPEERPKIPIAVARHVSSLGLPGRRPCLATAASSIRVAPEVLAWVRGGAARCGGRTPSPALPARGRVLGGVGGEGGDEVNGIGYPDQPFGSIVSLPLAGRDQGWGSCHPLSAGGTTPTPCRTLPSRGRGDRGATRRPSFPAEDGREVLLFAIRSHPLIPADSMMACVTRRWKIR